MRLTVDVLQLDTAADLVGRHQSEVVCRVSDDVTFGVRVVSDRAR